MMKDKRGGGVASAASIPFELVHGTVAIQDNDQEMPDAGKALITNAGSRYNVGRVPTTNAGSGYNVASSADNLQEDSPPVPNDPNYPASEVMPERSVASPVIAPSYFVVTPSTSVVAPSTPVIPPPGSFIAPSGRNERNEQELEDLSSDESTNRNRDTLPGPVVSRPIVPATVGQIVTSQLVREPALLAAAIRGPIDREPALLAAVIRGPIDESSSSNESLTDNLGNIPAQIVPVPGGMGSAPARREPVVVEAAPARREPVVPALVIRAPIVPPPNFAEDDRPQVPRWPILLHVHDLLRLEIIELLPWNQLFNWYTFAANQLRANVVSSSSVGIFNYLRRMYDSRTVDPTGLPWLLTTAAWCCG
jgi:hypothetical protein